MGCLGFWLIGYGIAYGVTEGSQGGFMGTNSWYYAGSGFMYMREDNYMKWVFQYAFAATASTIVSGALAERC